MQPVGPSDEIGQLGVIVRAMNGLPDTAQQRVMAYLINRYGNGVVVQWCNWCPEPNAPDPKSHPKGQPAHINLT
jgi:hypothetical protein